MTCGVSSSGIGTNTACASLLHVIPNEGPTSNNLPNLTKKAINKGTTKKTKGAHLEDPIRLDGIHAQTCPLTARDDLAPVRDRARAPPQRPIRSEHRAER